MSYFMGKEGFTWWQGVVEDRHDPLYLGRCRVRVLGWHDEDKNAMPTHSLPWAYPVAPITSASQTGVGTTPLGPVEGTWVIGFYRDGDAGQEPMFFGTLGGIPELDAKGVNNDGTGIGGRGFFDPRLEGGDIGHPLFEDEQGSRDLAYNPATDMVPREPASIIHDANPNPSEDSQTVQISESVTLANAVNVKTLQDDVEKAQFTVKVVENPIRSTYPDTGLGNTDISVTRNLNYLKEPTTNRLARGTRGNTDASDPRVSGIVYEKLENRKAGQLEIPTASGRSWDEPKTSWAARYPYNHVHQTESGHVIEMDDTPNWERMHWYHRTGTFTEIHPTGIKVEKVVNNYYDIILGARYQHIESNDFLTVDGSSETLIKGTKQEVVQGDNALEVNDGRYYVKNATGEIELNASDINLVASQSLTLTANNVNIVKKSAENTEKTVGNETKQVGGNYKVRSGSYSINTQGGAGIQTGGGFAVNATDSINESVFGLLPAAQMGYGAKRSATLGKIGFECTDNLISGGIEMNLGMGGLGASMSIMPLGDIKFDSVLGLGGIEGNALLGDVKFSSLLASMTLGLSGSATMNSLLSTLTLGNTGSAGMEGLLGEVSIGVSGKVKVKGLVISMKEAFDELIDILTQHTHPTGTGPSGPPMPPGSIKISLLKSLKIGLSFE